MIFDCIVIYIYETIFKIQFFYNLLYIWFSFQYIKIYSNIRYQILNKIKYIYLLYILILIYIMIIYNTYVNLNTYYKIIYIKGIFYIIIFNITSVICLTDCCRLTDFDYII